VLVPLVDADSVLSPAWWLLRLGRQLRDRKQKKLTLYREYYRGEQLLPQIPVEDRNAWLEFQRKARTNMCKMVVRATVARQLCIGVNDGHGKEDAQAWEWLQRNRWDSQQKKLFRAIRSTGWGYTMVSEHPRRPRQPLITVEHPDQVIVERDPATGDVRAALKAWWDDIERVGRASLYLAPETAAGKTMNHRFKTETWSPNRALPWGETNWEESGDPVVTRFDRPPVVPFENIPDLGEEPEPDFWEVRDIQDRFNLQVLNRMFVERNMAQPQAYAVGAKVKKRVDPITGLEVAENPFPRGRASVWVNENESGSFGQLPPADLNNLLIAHAFEIRTLFVLTSTPAYYMPGDLVNVSTDTVMALDANHVEKVRELNTDDGEGIEETLGLAAQIAGVDSDFSQHEVRWQDPRHLNPAVLADMGVKKKNMGWPLAMVAEDMGESPQRVSRLRTEAAAEAMQQAALAPTFQQAGQPRQTSTTGQQETAQLAAAGLATGAA
jgi:hypothetical protein